MRRHEWNMRLNSGAYNNNRRSIYKNRRREVSNDHPLCRIYTDPRHPRHQFRSTRAPLIFTPLASSRMLLPFDLTSTDPSVMTIFEAPRWTSKAPPSEDGAGNPL
jgi:hypothetical protein